MRVRMRRHLVRGAPAGKLLGLPGLASEEEKCIVGLGLKLGNELVGR
jgi:hypothetical protein